MRELKTALLSLLTNDAEVHAAIRAIRTVERETDLDAELLHVVTGPSQTRAAIQALVRET